MSGRSLRLPGQRTLLVVLAGAALSVGCAASGSFDPDAGAAGPDGAPGMIDAGDGPTVLPFAVDDWYGPSGYMGDGASPGGITDQTVCLSPRPDTWIGHCHRFTWTPGTVKWAGVYWQFPDGNWGEKMGLVVPPGATKVSFQAWGMVGGEKVSFVTGMKAVDGFELKKDMAVLTTTPQQFSIDLAGTSYSRVVGGFGWTAADSTVPVTFNIDDIRWE
jgi:hypothetical protein